MAQGGGVDLFDAYFKRADLDHDGKISGIEAVTFFQASGLPKHVLAQIWNHADQNRTGFLGRPEFYNALKLVTVAQSKRELTPDIVKAALLGPAAAKIPAPQMNLAVLPSQSQGNPVPAPQMGGVAPNASQNLGYRGPQVNPNPGMNQQQQQQPRPPQQQQQYFQPQGNQVMRPPQPMPVGSVPMQGFPSQGTTGGNNMGAPRPPTSNASTDWLGSRAGGDPMGPSSQIPNRGPNPPPGMDGFGMPFSGSTSALPPRPQLAAGTVGKPQDQGLPLLQTVPKDSKPPASGNGFSSDSIFGGDVFSAIPKQGGTAQSSPATSIPASAATVPVTTGTQTSTRQSPLDLNTFSMHPTGSQAQRPPIPLRQNQQVPGNSVGPGNFGSNQAQLPWPRMVQSDVQKYTKVFVAVDKDRDGKITGEEARSLFLSWNLPREVLKQVWDLSDQDNDSMLSLREFCAALYLMERFREGRPLPAVLPSSIMFDESLFPAAGQPTAAYGNQAWGPNPGFQQPHGMPGARPVVPPTGSRSQKEGPIQIQNDNIVQPNQQKSRVPVLEKHLVNQLSNEEQNSLNTKFQEATEADKKVADLEKEILDSKEKIEYYRTKMQELILYKSRCDNRLNEITERASADKKEVESLTKKYEEKYKQVGDVASKLTIEEATFRDIQERKMELYNAIVKIEQGGSADGILQVRADRIQSDLEELVKGLSERCKKYGLRVKPTALVELPFGWQPGIQEGAADWDEDWDKFEDEGFAFVKDLTLDVQNVVAPPKEKTKPVWKDKATDKVFIEETTSDVDGKSEEPSKTGKLGHESSSAYAQSEDESARSPAGSPTGRSTVDSPHEFRDNHFGRNSEANASPRFEESYSDHGGADSIISGDKGFDEWGTFDMNEDTDSVWGLNTKEPYDNDRNGENAFFGPGSNLGLNPIRTESPQGNSLFGKKSPLGFADSVSNSPQGNNLLAKKSPFAFADSVPGTPLFNSNSPRRYSEGSEDHSFDNFSHFDSFNMNDSGFFGQQGSLGRFDSMRSTTEQQPGLARFDSMRSTSEHAFPFFGQQGSTSEQGTGLARFDSMRSTTEQQPGLARFDSMRNTSEHAFTSFDDADPFGSTGPFKTLSETPRRGSDKWSAF